MPYDSLIVSTGAGHSYLGNDGWEAHAPGLKTLEDALEIRRRALLAFEQAERQEDPEDRRRWLTFVVIGGGPTGVEMAGRRLAHDGALLSNLTRMFVETVHAFYAERAAREGSLGAKTGAVTAVQRTSSDLRLNPHLHVVALDGAWHEQGGELCWQGWGTCRRARTAPCSLAPSRASSGTFAGAACSGSTRTAPIRTSLAIPRAT